MCASEQSGLSEGCCWGVSVGDVQLPQGKPQLHKG